MHIGQRVYVTENAHYFKGIYGEYMCNIFYFTMSMSLTRHQISNAYRDCPTITIHLSTNGIFI